MKNLFAAAASCALLLALGVFVHHRLSPTLQSADRPETLRPLPKREDPANAQHPSPLGYGVVNEARLRRLEADPNYRGPSFRENREASLPQRLSGEKKPNSRIPAGQ